MSAIKNPIVVKCKECGQQMILESLQTKTTDPNGELLFDLAKQIANNSLCAWCKARKEREK